MLIISMLIDMFAHYAIRQLFMVRDSGLTVCQLLWYVTN